MRLPFSPRATALSAAITMAIPIAFLASAASAQAPPFIPGLIDSAALDSSVVASGTLFREDGSLAPAGTLVRMSVWPSPEVLAEMEIGESVKISPVGYAVTDAAGGFQLRVSNGALVSRYVSAKTGRAEFEISAVIDGTPAIFNLSSDRAAVASSNTRAATPANADARNIELKPLPGGSKATSAVDSDGQKSLEKACTGTLISNYSPWVTVLQGFAPSGVKMTAGYSTGASSTLGVGTSLSGSSGSFSASGTSTISSDASIGFAAVTVPAGKHWKTQFRYSKFMYYCYEQNPSTTYQTRPVDFIGGTQALNATAPSATYCSTYNAGDHFTKNDSTATTFSGGVDISGSIGIDLSARTGYSSTAKLRFDFTATRNLCGTSGFPPGNAGRLVAKP
jgi:hypothetical protein